MFVPRRLQKNFEVSEEGHGANVLVKGALRCCNQHNFNLKYVGRVESGVINRSVIHPDDGTVVLDAACIICGRVTQVFNSNTDGYDSSVSSVETLSVPAQNVFPCSKCSTLAFTIDITFEYQTKEELEKEGVLDYENAFSWIWITVTCMSCGRKHKNLIDMELS